VLRGASEDVESLIGGDPLTFHEDALRLSDQLARSQWPARIISQVFCEERRPAARRVQAGPFVQGDLLLIEFESDRAP